jgi:large conductance mechanosensitive channel
MSIWKDFKKFALRGNVIDLAVAVIVGGAFGKITTSLVNDIIMPPIGLLLGKVNFTNLYINLSNKHYDSLADAQKNGAPTLNYGMFINTVLDFVIIAFVIFLVLRQLNRFKKNEQKPDPMTKECPHCLSDIPLKASRCKFCTSALDNEPEKAS